MNVEMQQDDEGNIERRILHYWGRGYTRELKEGEDYATLPRQIHIAITDFDVFKWQDKTKFHGIFYILERDEGVLFSDALEIHVLELPKLRRQPMKAEWTALERWCLYLDNLEGETMERIATQDPLIGRALTVEDIFAKVDEERYMYELREGNRNDYLNAMNTAKKRGIAEGIEKGIERGKAEALRETARSMLAEGMAPASIAKITSLPIGEIEALRRQI
jgi:predicted transposase/invertase (TIGR01784 family)